MHFLVLEQGMAERLTVLWRGLRMDLVAGQDDCLRGATTQ